MKKILFVLGLFVVVLLGVWLTKDGGPIDRAIFGGGLPGTIPPGKPKTLNCSGYNGNPSELACAIRADVDARIAYMRYLLELVRLMRTAMPR